MGETGKPGSSAGDWHWRAARRYRVSRATGTPGAAWLCKVPSTSYVEGALFYSARRRHFYQDRHAGIRRAAIRAYRPGGCLARGPARAPMAAVRAADDQRVSGDQIS